METPGNDDKLHTLTIQVLIRDSEMVIINEYARTMGLEGESLDSIMNALITGAIIDEREAQTDPVVLKARAATLVEIEEIRRKIKSRSKGDARA